MNKKYLVGGLIFWAGLSGYMGLRILESYTEDAVYAALSAVPAQAQEIKFSFLNSSLTLKNVEYEIPDEKAIHKGTIEHVELKGFNRKIMFVKPDMPPYQAAELPRVAESLILTGISDSVHSGKDKIEQKIDSVEIRGWYQRLGLLLDRYRDAKNKEGFYEELFRCRLDEFRINNTEISVSTPGLTKPVFTSIQEVALAGGIKAPEGDHKNTPISLFLRGIDISAGTFTGSIARIDLRDILFPEPERIVRLIELADSVNDGNAEQKVPEFMAVLAEAYETQTPFTLLGMQGASASIAGIADPLTLDGISYTYNLKDKVYTSSAALSRLHVRPAMLGKYKEDVLRYSSEGVIVDIKGSSAFDDSSAEGDVLYELQGLGKLGVKWALEGDIASLRKLSWDFRLLEEFDPSSLLTMLKLKKLNFQYTDSGLMPLLLSVAAREQGDKPEELLQLGEMVTAEVAADPNPLLQNLGKALREQLAAPGELTVDFAPRVSMSIQDMVMLFMLQPDKLPVSVISTPGEKTMLESLAIR